MVSYEEVLKTLVGLGLKEIDAAIYLLAREKAQRKKYS